MRHSFTKQCVTFGSALLLGLASSQAQAQSDANRPSQKALINLESNFVTRWMTGDKSKDSASDAGAAANTPVPQPGAVVPASATAPAAEPTRKALLPPNSILNRNYPPQTSPTAAATPLPPTTLVFGPAPASPLPGSTPLQQPGLQQPGVVPLQQPTMLPGARPMAAPIGTTLPAGIAQAQLVAAQSPIVGGQAPVILVVPAGWQPEGPVTFAPRTVMSPEVPAEHWPTVQRNPFGDRVDRGIFTWPKFAKQIAGATLEGQEVAPPTTNSKALFAASNTAPAEVQPQAKALFAPDPNAAAATQPVTQSKALFAPAPATAPVAPPAPESRALFASQTTPAAKPTTKSKALFGFGRKEEPAREANAPTQVADARMAPATTATAPAASQATTSMPVDPSEAPPEAPKLSDFESMPSAAAPVPSKPQVPKPAEKKAEVASSGMKWRAKGSPMSDATVETVKPAEEPEATQPATAQPESPQSTTAPTQIVEQVPAAPANPTAQAAPATGVNAAAPQTAPAHHAPATAALPAAPANQKALFATSMFSRGGVPAAHTRAPSRLAAAAPRVTAPPRPAEKAIVPNLMSMVPGLKEVVVGTDVAPAVTHEVTPATATESADDPTNQHVTRVSTEDQAATARSTQSYYAPAAEYPVEEPQFRSRTVKTVKTQTTPVATSSRRKTRPAEEVEEAVEVEETDEVAVEEVVEESREEVYADEPVVKQERRQPIVESPFERQPRKNLAAGTPSNGARAAEQRATKTYRRLTTKDLTAGLSRPLNALNQMTKLPPTVTRYASDTTNADLEAFEQDARGNYAHSNADAVTSHPPIKRTPVARRPAGRSNVETNPSEPAAVVGDAEASAEREAEPTVIRSGRRRVVTPAVVREPVEEAGETDDVRAEVSEESDAAEPEMKATKVRNKSGASVLIYSGADLSNDRGQTTRRVSGIETSDAGRNPLR